MKTYRAELLACCLLVAGTWAALGSCLSNDFVNFDDNDYVTNNYHLGMGFSLDGISWAFEETHIQGHWHPLTWISLAIDCQMWGYNPWGYHLTNLVLHTANILLLFLWLRRATGSVWRSAAVAGFFALHPLHVESVAWVTERKDMLSTFFELLTLHAYLSFLARPRRDWYLLVLLGFALALLSKPMVVTLPCLMLLLDYWPLRRWGWSGDPSLDSGVWGGRASLRRLLLEKAPLFVMVAISSVITYSAMTRGGVLKALPGFSLADRFGYRMVMYVEYLRKMLWPSDLAVFYPMPENPWPVGTVLLAGGLLAAISLFCIAQRRPRPYLLVGWLWYLGTLVPVNGPFQVASYALADRNTYVPAIGVFLALVWGLADMVPVRWRSLVLVPTVSCALVTCAVASWFQVAVWHDSLKLWEHALEVTDANYFVHLKLAETYRDLGRDNEALVHYREAARMRPDEPRLHFYLGQFLLSRQRYQEAVPSLQKAIALNSHEQKYHGALGRALQELGRAEEAEREYAESHRLYKNERKR